MVKNTQTFCENRKNHGKDTTSNHLPEGSRPTVYRTQHLESRPIPEEPEVRLYFISAQVSQTAPNSLLATLTQPQVQEPSTY